MNALDHAVFAPRPRAFEVGAHAMLTSIFVSARALVLWAGGACDRCDDEIATTSVMCAYGCVHLQCEDCADVTRSEADRS